MNPHQSALAHLVEMERNERNIPMAQVAREAGVQPSTLWRFMHGKSVISDAVWSIYEWLDREAG